MKKIVIMIGRELLALLWTFALYSVFITVPCVKYAKIRNTEEKKMAFFM